MNPQQTRDDDLLMMRQAVTSLLLESKPSAAFLARLAMNLKFEPSYSVETLETDGTELRFNPDFMRERTPAERVFLVAHETWHVAQLHPYRRGGRDPHLYNVSADHRTNLDLIEWGIGQAPKDAYADPQYAGPQWSTEAIYAKLSNDRDKEPDDSGEAGQAGQPNVMPGCPTGQFVDAPADAQATDKDGEPQPPPMTAADWAVAAEEAALVARAAGDMAGGATRGLQSSRAPQVDWVTELKHYLAHVIVTGQSWSSPNRRFIGSGLYLPGPVKDHVGEIVIGIDTSASVSQRMLDIFASEVTGILAEVAPVKVTVVYCDYDVQGSAEFEPGDDVKLELKGGGGTRFQPVYDFVEAAEIAPLVLVYLSDLEGPAPAEPSYPTLWCTPTWIDHPAPFGEVIRVDIES